MAIKKIYRYNHDTGRVEPYHPSHPSHVGMQIIPDIEPYKEMHSGTIISSRREHKEFLRRNGLIEVGNERDFIMRHRGRTPENDY